MKLRSKMIYAVSFFFMLILSACSCAAAEDEIDLSSYLFTNTDQVKEDFPDLKEGWNMGVFYDYNDEVSFGSALERDGGRIINSVLLKKDGR